MMKPSWSICARRPDSKGTRTDILMTDQMVLSLFKFTQETLAGKALPLKVSAMDDSSAGVTLWEPGAVRANKSGRPYNCQCKVDQ